MISRAAARAITPLSILLLLTIPYHVAAQFSSPNESRDPYPNYTRVTPAMALIIVILIAALFLMGFFSIYIRHCADATGGPPARGVVPGGRSRRLAARGLDAETIETFPTLVYSVVKGMKIGKSALECAVCLSEFEDDETLRLIPKCDHVFHPECIDEWLSSHTTCPVCRADLMLEPGESVPQLSDLHPELWDIENQNGAVEVRREEGAASNDDERNVDMLAPEPEVMVVNQTLNRNRTCGSTTRRFPRSHSTGHSLVQPGENTERFTLRLPVEVRKKIMDQQLNRTLSMVGLPREGSSRRGYRTAGGEGGKSFNYRRLERLDQQAKSDRWIFNRTPSFLTRASTLLTRVSSFKSPKVASKEGADGSNRSSGPNMVEPSLRPVYQQNSGVYN